MRHIHFSLLKAGLLSLTLLTFAIPNFARANGGIFVEPGKGMRIATRIVFTVNKASSTITETIDFDYSYSKVPEFVWLLPIPSAPDTTAPQITIDTNATGLPSYLEADTSVGFIDPPDYCGMTVDLLRAHQPVGGGVTPAFIGSGDTPADTQLFQNNQATNFFSWLNSAKIQLDKTTRNAINQYFGAGYAFAVLHYIIQDQGMFGGTIAPVTLTYQSDKLILPIQLDRISQPQSPLNIWIFADTQYEPTNYPHVALAADWTSELTGLKAQPESGHIGTGEKDYLASFYESSIYETPWYIADPARLYDASRTGLQTKDNQPVFSTEYAGRSSEPLDRGYSDPLAYSDVPFANLFKQYRYLTHLSTFVSTNGLKNDPIFAPVLDAPDVPNSYPIPADPLAFWGCNAAAAISPKVINEFSKNHQTFDNLHFTAGFPKGWKLTTLTIDGIDPHSHTQVNHIGKPMTHTVFMYAPRTVTKADLDSYNNGRAKLPIFIFTAIAEPDRGSWLESLFYNVTHWDDTSSPGHIMIDGAAGILKDALGYPRWVTSNEGIPVDEVANDVTINPQIRNAPITGVAYAILTSGTDWKNHQTLYQDMLTYAGAHLYSASPDALDTLFLDGNFGMPSLPYAIPIPDHWYSHVASNGDIVIFPDETTDTDQAPTMRLIPVGTHLTNLGPGFSMQYSFPLQPFQADDPALSTLVTRVLTTYELPALRRDDIINDLSSCSDPAAIQSNAFTGNGITGEILFTNQYIAIISASANDWPNYTKILNEMLNAYQNEFVCPVNP